VKLNDIIQEFKIYMSNEEQAVFERCERLRPLRSFSERDQVIIESLIRKSLVSKISKNGIIMVLANDL
jgi:hypothetical protein